MTFPRRMRLSRARDFERVYRSGVVKHVGPLRVHGAANEFGFPRLGLSVPRRVGRATQRNRIKRLIRECFRVMQHEIPAYDFLVVVHPHEPLALAEYRELLAQAAQSIDRQWKKRSSDDRA